MPDLHTAGDTEPDQPVPAALPQRQPVLLVVLVAVLTEAGGAVLLLANDYTVAGILVAVGTLLTGVGGALARRLVTPLVDAKDNDGDPLVAVPVDPA